MGRTPRSSKPRARRASDPPPAARAGTRDRPSEATPAVLRSATADRWFGDLLESAPDAIVGVDDQGRIVLINSQTEKIFGYGRDELLNQPVEILLPERVRRAHERHRAGYVVDPRTRPMGVGLDLAGRRKDGSEFPAEISLSPFQTRDGVIVTSIIRDISDRRKVEGKFRGLLEAAPDAMIIVERTGRIVRVNSQAERVFGYRRDQLLGQPVEMLVPERFRGHHPEHRVAYFEGPRVRAMGSGLELYGLRRDGSEFPVEISLSPLETEEGILVTSAIRDVSERRALVRERAARAEAEKLVLELLVDPGAGLVLGDPLRLQQVVWNLLSNAVKFTPAGGRIELRLASAGSHVELTVTDTGQGIAPAFLPQLFQRFRQADSSSRRAHGGLGIGLAIVRTLVELHGGSVEAASRGEGQGATFTVRLPLLERQSVLGPGQRRRGVGTDPAGLHGLHVLIVEDDPDTSSVLAELVAEHGAEARTAASVAEALDVLGRWRVDLLLSDIGMPGEDGYALIEKVRRQESAQGAKALPAVAITAYARKEDRESALAAGFDTHVAKPLDPEELLATLAEVAGRGGPTAS